MDVRSLRQYVLVTALCACLAAAPAFPQGSELARAAQRKSMVADIDAMASSTERETGRFHFADRVMRAMEKVPRHRFVPDDLAHIAYRNQPLPIGEGQTISQPYIVALSTDFIDPKPGHVVLEIGTGSGYQAAVLAELVKQVFSIEIVEPLGREAAKRLTTLGYSNVEVRIGDGYQGWPEKAPFDGIIVTAAAPFIPDPLVKQLKPGGKMVIPVGSQLGGQELLLIQKRLDGSVTRKVLLPVRFVPMTGKGVESRP
jgi:protein-L-isoaspartate(D-aspartate) O-methyltransferase